MSSITGFNTSVAGAFSQGEPLSASKLNKLASGIELTKTQFSDGLLFQGGPSGVPYTTQYPTPLLIPGQGVNKFEQFQLYIEGDRLQVAGGTVLWAPHWFNDDDRPDQSLCANQSIVNTYARYTGDSVVVGTDSNSPFMSENGYVTLSL
jgi:hypothetical protein